MGHSMGIWVAVKFQLPSLSVNGLRVDENLRFFFCFLSPKSATGERAAEKGAVSPLMEGGLGTVVASPAGFRLLPGGRSPIPNSVNRALLLTFAMAATGLSGCATLDEFFADLDDEPQVVYVREPSRPVIYDPYYNQAKIYRQPRYYEETSKKKKGDKVTKTKTIKNEYGQTVYKEKTTETKKKKKK